MQLLHSSSPPRSLVRAVGAFVVAAACVGLAAPRAARAQSGVIAGQILDQGRQPVASAQVSVRGTQLGALTDQSGRFRVSGLTQAPGSTVTLEVKRIGFAGATRAVRVGDENVTVVLGNAVVSLNEVVTTGQVVGTEKRELGVDLSQVDVTSVVQQAPVNNVQDVLNGRAAGVTVLENSGMVGSGATVRIRGLSSFSLSNQPLIYVDGVRVDNSQSTGPTNQAFGASTTSRWNDFSPDDIENIEIVKGSAATTLYGTDAANGVIQIFTKRGAAGRAQWNFTARVGVNQFANQDSRVYTNWGPDASGKIVSINQAQRMSDAGTPVFPNGHLQTYNLSVSGGTPLIRYYASGGYEDNKGVELNNRQGLYTGRGTMTITPSDKWDISANLGFTQGKTDLGFEAGGGGPTWTTYYATPTNLNNPHNGFYSGTPSAYYEEYQDYQNFNRFTGGVTVNHHPVSWFNHRLTIGTDRGYEDSEEFAGVHHDLSYFFDVDADSGYKTVDTRDNSQTNVDYGGQFKFNLPHSFTSSTQFGTDIYYRVTKYVGAYGQDFPAPGLSALSQTTAQKTGYEYSVQNNTVGIFAQQEFGWRDRLFVTAGVRRDDNSAFGPRFKNVYYPKFSASWVISEEPFIPVPKFVNTFRLRAAYGESGQAPPPYVAVPAFTATQGPNGTAAVTPLTAGNLNLGPERGYETELGFDASFFGDRAGAEFTYFTGGTRQAILQTQVPPSSGFPGTQYVNAGKLSRHGVELLLRGTPWSMKNRSLDLSLTLGTNDTKVVSLVGNQTSILASTNVYHRVGYPVGSWFGKKVVGATVNQTTGAVSNVMCDSSGTAISCASAPLEFLGRTTPTLEGSLNGTLHLTQTLSVYAQLDRKSGYYKLNGDERVRCHLFAECRVNYFPLEYPAWYVGATSSSAYISDIIQDASYTKLREVSATYSLPTGWANRFGASRLSITVAGRNLATWTKYKGMDPEASFQGGSRGFGQWEQDVLPQLRQFVTTFNLSF